MRIRHICYPVRVLGPGERVGIWVAGCSLGCPGCMTPELQNPASGRELAHGEIVRLISQSAAAVDGITVSGGEPFDQPQQLRLLVQLLRGQVTEDIIVYSGYTLQQLRDRGCPDTDAVLDAIAVLIDGPYVEERNDGKGLRGSSNQRIHIFRDPGRYRYMEDCPRQLQVFHYANASSLMVGLL